MGKITRYGNGYGMTEEEAKDDFAKRLTQEYGEGLYRGGGQDIRSWKKSKCEEKPVKGKVPKQTSSSEHKKDNATLVNGFIVTNFDERKKMFHYLDRKPVTEERKLALTQTEAKKIAKELALKVNNSVYILPARLWKDKNNKLFEAEKVLTVSPKGGTKDKPGKWYFEVECAY